jgi:hypothetical protein
MLHSVIRPYRLLALLLFALLALALPGVPTLAQDNPAPSPSPDDNVDGRHCDTPTWPNALPSCEGSDDTIAVCAPAPAMLTGLSFSLPIWIDTDADVGTLGIDSWQFGMTFDPDILRITSVSQQGTLSEAWDVTYDADTPGQSALQGSGPTPLDATGRIIYLEINVIGDAGTVSDLAFSAFAFNTSDLNVTTRSGRVSVFADDECPSDLDQLVYLPIVGG